MSEDKGTQEWSVVVNDEEQYSIWAVNRQIPDGWKETGVRGTQEECLSHIDRVWSDMRPLSLRLAMDAAG
ncbi:MbtH family protein [Streptomyces sp. x-19]|uniref:MbtH family protein n=1 Tax=Streptomyces sp. x-19 TaxID=2789280 RepID=UPI0039818C0B